MNKTLIEHKKTKYFRVGLRIIFESKTHKKKLNANSWSVRKHGLEPERVTKYLRR